MRVYYFNKNWRGKTTRQLRQIVARLFFLTSFFYVYRTILKKELKIAKEECAAKKVTAQPSKPTARRAAVKKV